MSKNIIKIISIFDKNEDFIELQYKSILKNITCDYEYIVFNNGHNSIQVDSINTICSKYGITCFDIASVLTSKKDMINSFGGPSEKAGLAMNIAFSNLKDSIVFKIDSDMFFCNPTNLSEEMNNVDLKYSPNFHGDKECIWSGYFGINLKKVNEFIDFLPGVIPNTDTFGSSINLVSNENYTKSRDILYCVLEEDNKTIKAMINNASNVHINSKNVIFIENDIFFRYYDIQNFKKNINKRLKILKNLSFPKPYHIDFISFNYEDDNLIHFKSSNWYSWPDEYVKDKKLKIRKFLDL